jgi:hypothetical protein
MGASNSAPIKQRYGEFRDRTRVGVGRLRDLLEEMEGDKGAAGRYVRRADALQDELRRYERKVSKCSARYGTSVIRSSRSIARELNKKFGEGLEEMLKSAKPDDGASMMRVVGDVSRRVGELKARIPNKVVDVGILRRELYARLENAKLTAGQKLDIKTNIEDLRKSKNPKQDFEKIVRKFERQQPSKLNAGSQTNNRNAGISRTASTASTIPYKGAQSNSAAGLARISRNIQQLKNSINRNRTRYSGNFNEIMQHFKNAENGVKRKNEKQAQISLDKARTQLNKATLIAEMERFQKEHPGNDKISNLIRSLKKKGFDAKIPEIRKLFERESEIQLKRKQRSNKRKQTSGNVSTSLLFNTRKEKKD